MTLVTSEIRDQIAAGNDAETVIKTAIDTAINTYAKSRKREDRPNRYFTTITSDLTAMTETAETFSTAEIDALDPACVPGWIEELRGAARAIERLAARLERRIPARRRA